MTYYAGYDGDGLRAWESNSSGQNSVYCSYYLYDGDTPVCRMTNTGAVNVVFTFGANGLVSTGALYTFDPQGSLAQMLNDTTVYTSNLYSATGTGSTSDTGFARNGYGAQWGYFTDPLETGGLVLCGHLK